MRIRKPCSIDNCDKLSHAKTFCDKHYQRYKKFGSPFIVKAKKRGGIPSHPLYHNYFNMLTRCYTKSYWQYKRYGGRGIKVCKKWLGIKGFPNFIKDIGNRPSEEHSLDRIDLDGNYTPKNCRWATKYQQMANTLYSNDNPGVGWHKQRQKWRARIKVRGKEISLGLYKTKEEAIKVRKEYQTKYNYV